MNNPVAFHSNRRHKDEIIPLDPPIVHFSAYTTGGLRKLYSHIIKNKESGFPLYDYGQFTDQHGKFHLSGECTLASRYKVLNILSSHGQSAVILQAEDEFNGGKLVIIKVLHTRWFKFGTQEAHCLRRLTASDPYNVSGTVKLLNTFLFDDHYCMVFDSLVPLPLTEIFQDFPREKLLPNIKKVALKLLTTLGFLRQQNLIHADLKPENILLKSEGDINSVTLIDFGNAIHDVFKEVSLYYKTFELQTLLYRAPEVMFGIPFGTEIDMWSLGCILAELYKGRPLFPGTSKITVIKEMKKLLGPFPRDVYQRGKFYTDLQNYTDDVKQRDAVTILYKKLDCRDYLFRDFLAGFLRYNPSERFTPLEAAQHPFLATELPVSFLMPQSTGLKTVGSYSHRPVKVKNETTSDLISSPSNMLMSSGATLSLGSLATGLCQSHGTIDKEIRRSADRVLPHTKKETQDLANTEAFYNSNHNVRDRTYSVKDRTFLSPKTRMKSSPVFTSLSPKPKMKKSPTLYANESENVANYTKNDMMTSHNSADVSRRMRRESDMKSPGHQTVSKSSPVTESSQKQIHKDRVDLELKKDIKNMWSDSKFDEREGHNGGNGERRRRTKEDFDGETEKYSQLRNIYPHSASIPAKQTNIETLKYGRAERDDRKYRDEENRYDQYHSQHYAIYSEPTEEDLETASGQRERIFITHKNSEIWSPNTRKYVDSPKDVQRKDILSPNTGKYVDSPKDVQRKDILSPNTRKYVDSPKDAQRKQDLKDILKAIASEQEYVERDLGERDKIDVKKRQFNVDLRSQHFKHDYKNLQNTAFSPRARRLSPFVNYEEKIKERRKSESSETEYDCVRRSYDGKGRPPPHPVPAVKYSNHPDRDTVGSSAEGVSEEEGEEYRRLPESSEDRKVLKKTRGRKVLKRARGKGVTNRCKKESERATGENINEQSKDRGDLEELYDNRDKLEDDRERYCRGRASVENSENTRRGNKYSKYPQKKICTPSEFNESGIIPLARSGRRKSREFSEDDNFTVDEEQPDLTEVSSQKSTEVCVVKRSTFVSGSGTERSHQKLEDIATSNKLRQKIRKRDENPHRKTEENASYDSNWKSRQRFSQDDGHVKQTGISRKFKNCKQRALSKENYKTFPKSQRQSSSQNELHGDKVLDSDNDNAQSPVEERVRNLQNISTDDQTITVPKPRVKKRLLFTKALVPLKSDRKQCVLNNRRVRKRQNLVNFSARRVRCLRSDTGNSSDPYQFQNDPTSPLIYKLKTNKAAERKLQRRPPSGLEDSLTNLVSHKSQGTVRSKDNPNLKRSCDTTYHHSDSIRTCEPPVQNTYRAKRRKLVSLEESPVPGATGAKRRDVHSVTLSMNSSVTVSPWKHGCYGLDVRVTANEQSVANSDEESEHLCLIGSPGH